MSLFASLSLFISSMRGSMYSITHPPTLSAATLAPGGGATDSTTRDNRNLYLH